MTKKEPDKIEKRDNPHPEALMYKQSQLGVITGAGKTTYERWIKDGTITGITMDVGGTKFFLRETLCMELRSRFIMQNPERWYEIGGG